MTTKTLVLITLSLVLALKLFGSQSAVTAIHRHLERQKFVDGHNPLPKSASYVPHNFLSIQNKTSCELTITTDTGTRIIIPPHSGYVTKKEEELCK